MINLSEIASSTEERMLTSVKASQTLVIDGIKRIVEFADRVVPEAMGDRIEAQVTNLPSASPVIDGAFDFAAKMLDAQREFVAEIVQILQPAAAAAPKAAATKAPAKKAPAKKAAAKKTTARKAAARKAA